MFNQTLHIMADLLKNIAHSGGFIVTVIVDGDERPDCKRDSWSRIKSRELDDINRRYCRMKAMAYYSKVNNGTASDEEKKKYEMLSKAAKSFENKCSKSKFEIPPDFHIRLSEKLLSINACNCNENGGFVSEHVLKAKFQADSVIACRSIQKKSNFVMSKDSDFPALIGSDCNLLCDVSE